MRKFDYPEKVKESEILTISYPEQVVTIAAYRNFRVGGLTLSVPVNPGESREDAFNNAWEFLRKCVKKQYADAREDYFERLKDG